jgi:GNAT superfamily N-acetyltransferase
MVAVSKAPSPAPSFTIRTASAAESTEDRAAIRAVIAELIPSLDADQRLRWLYDTNAGGRAITWIAIDDATGEVAGATSYFPFAMAIGGEPVRGAVGGDGYVRPAFRRRGIASALHAAAHAAMPILGIDVMYGAPTGANVSPLQAGGSKVVGEVVRYFRPLRGRAFGVGGVGDRLAARVLAPRHGHETLEPVAGLDPRIDEVWDRARRELPIAAVRDARFYQWRFTGSPSHAQRPYLIVDGDHAIAACALESLDRRLRIIDLVAPGDAWGRALAAIERFAEAAGHDAVEIKLMTDDAKRRGLWKFGFVPRERKPFLCVVPTGSPRTATLHDAGKWFYTGADSDIDTLAE